MFLDVVKLFLFYNNSISILTNKITLNFEFEENTSQFLFN